MPHGDAVAAVESRAPSPPRRRALQRLTAAALAAAGGAPLAGCGSPPPPPPKPQITRVNGTLQAVAGLNPSVSQRPSPLRLVIYELASASAFGKADFLSLYQADQGTLGSELVAREEVLLQPGETLPYARTLAPQTRYLGIVAVYRELAQATWRALLPVQPGRDHRLTLRADRLAIAAELQP